MSRRTSGSPALAVGHRRALLHIFDVTAIGLVVTDKKGLERRRKLLSIEVALLLRLDVCGAVPETYRNPGILIVRIL